MLLSLPLRAESTVSLFAYKVLLEGGKEKSAQITAKTEEAARKRVAAENKVVEWRELKVVAPPKPASPPPPAAPARKPSTAKGGTKLEKLLYLQSEKCFFCGRLLTKAEASVEHLLPKSKGGSNADDNVVACCVTLNRTFGSMPLKEKVRIILEKAGNFQCPKS